MKNYPVIIECSEEDAGFIARVPALKYCTAFGETYEEAAKEIESAISGWLAVAKEKGTPIPSSDPQVEDLRTVAKLIKLAYVSREANIPAQTLFTKIRRSTALQSSEASAIGRVFAAAGLSFTTIAPVKGEKAVKAKRTLGLRVKASRRPKMKLV